jgi:hypothetical protein
MPTPRWLTLALLLLSGGWLVANGQAQGWSAGAPRRDGTPVPPAVRSAPEPPQPTTETLLGPALPQTGTRPGGDPDRALERSYEAPLGSWRLEAPRLQPSPMVTDPPPRTRR